TEGEYEIAVSWEGCEETVIKASVPADPVLPCDCPTVNSVVIRENCNGGYSIVIDFDPASVLNACSYRVHHMDMVDSVDFNTEYQTLPQQLIIPITHPDAQSIGITAFCCEMNRW